MRAYHAQQSELHIQQQQPTSETDQQNTSATHRRTYYADQDVDAARAFICEKYKLSTESDAVRLALLLLAEAGGFQIKVAPAVAKRIVVKLKKPATV